MFQVSTISPSPTISLNQPEARPRRHQVSRACVWCRTYRIKCDARNPCRNCKDKGRKCASEHGKSEVRTFAGALRVIDRLNDRVKELEDKLRNLQPGDNMKDDIEDPEKKKNEDVRTRVGLTEKLHRTQSFPAYLDPLAQLGMRRKYYNWDVVSTRKSEFHQRTYGTSSSYYFLNQMTVYMEASLKEKGHSSRFTYPCPPERSIFDGGSRNSSGNDAVNGCDLSRSAEEAYLNIFWDFFNGIFPILDRTDFEIYYGSLWESPRALRCSSALTDVVLALCIQHEAHVSARHSLDMSGDTDAEAGIWWHRRSQQLLTNDLEEPSIATFQCYLLSVIWLSNAGLHNTAHSVMASGLRIGVILGLHLEPSEGLPTAQREFRKTLWWLAYAVEMRFAMELGRPLAVNCTQVTCSLPSDKAELSERVTDAASFPIHFVKLILASRAVYITFYRQCAEELDKSGKMSVYEDPAVLEECAKFLSSKIVYLRTWVQHVPKPLHLERTAGEPFSTDDLQLYLDTSPDVCQARRKVLLEIKYHTMAVSLFRPFIAFSAKQRPAAPNTDAHAMSCLKHAMAITAILYQACTETTLLEGLLEVWQWQWSAAISLVGYVLAYPSSPVLPYARKSLDTAVSVLRSRSKHAAAEVILELVAKADALIARAQNSSSTGNSVASVGEDDMQVLNMPESSELGWDFGFEYDDLSGPGSSMLGEYGVGFQSGSLSTLGGLDIDDQGMLEFLNFGGIGHV